MSILPVAKYISKFPQDPNRIRTIEGQQVIVDKNEVARYFLDGSPVKPDGRFQCTRKSNNSQYRCVRYAVQGYPVCQVHGAGSPLQGRPGGRKALPSSIRYKNLPQDLTETYERALSDKDLLALNSEISLITTRIDSLLKKLPTDEMSSAAISALVKVVMEMKSARAVGDVETVVALLPELFDLVDTVRAERSQWEELIDLTQDRGKLVSREVERRKLMKNYVTSEQAMELVKAVINVVNSHIKDQNVKTAIAVEIGRLIGYSK